MKLVSLFDLCLLHHAHLVTVSNLTSPVTGTLNMVTFSNWSYVYQVYANDTAPQENDVTPTTVKIFANACASGDQSQSCASYLSKMGTKE